MRQLKCAAALKIGESEAVGITLCCAFGAFDKAGKPVACIQVPAV